MTAERAAKSSGTVEAGFFRFKKLDGKYLITNDVGKHEFLTAGQFDDLVNGRLRKDEVIYLPLREKGFIRGEENVKGLAAGFLRKHLYLKSGPTLHIVVATMRCNFRCLYCQTSALDPGRKDLDMSEETARKVVDMIFQSPSEHLFLEFQGGEPLLNWSVVQFIVEYALEKQQATGKNLYITLVTNGSLLTDRRLNYLVEKKVALCISLDGHEAVHNHNRGANHGKVVKALRKATREYGKRYPMHMPGVLATLTRFSLDYPREIIDEYVRLEQEGIYLRPVNPIGHARKTTGKWDYSMRRFLDFYREAVDYIIELNKQGRYLMERTAQIFLVKILTDDDPGFVDIRSPCGAARGQLAYNYDGDVYTCDEGRMLAMLGDTSFRIGNVYSDTLTDVLNNGTAKAVCIASCLEGIPLCADCVYHPYCGVCPVLNYIDEGNIFSKIPTNDKHILFSGILDYLFTRMQEPETLKVFESWVSAR
ncbi:MAG: His-Xaa-Ser system radical SAM maturase HxsB [bacterium]